MTQQNQEGLQGLQPPSTELLRIFAPLQPVAGCYGIAVHQADDLYALWEAWEREAGREACPIPYWSIVWPAAAVLGRYLLNNKEVAAGKAVLDLGCGGAAASIAAAQAGASRVIANDVDPIALHIARLNIAANSVAVEVCYLDLTAEMNVPAFDLVLVGDLFYHRPTAPPILAFLHRAQRNGARILIADAGRKYAPTVAVTVIARETVAVNKEVEGVTEREVRLMELQGED